MASRNTRTTGEEQNSMAPTYQYMTIPNTLYQPPVVPSSYSPATGYASTQQGGYAPSASGNAQAQQAYYSTSTAYGSSMQQPTPGSMAALEQHFYTEQQAGTGSAIAQNTSSYAMQPSQSYQTTATSGFPTTTPITYSTTNTAGYMPTFPVMDQNMLAAAGPSSSAYTTPEFYESDSAWSYNNQEIQSSSSSTLAVGTSQSQNSATASSQSSATNPETTYACTIPNCGKSFNRSYNFRAHMETHSSNRVYPFECQVGDCDKRFRRKTDLSRHVQSVHERNREFGCEFCGRWFARKDTLRRHRDDGCSRRFAVGFELGGGEEGEEE